MALITPRAIHSHREHLTNSIEDFSDYKNSPPLIQIMDPSSDAPNQNYLKNTLKQQVERNLQLFNDIKLTGSAPEFGPVLNCQRKHISMTSRH